MKVKYISYGQAVDSCNNAQHLIGQPFDKGNELSGTVQRILVAPYSRILQWQYLRNVFAGIAPKDALVICRDNKYDVIVLSSNFRPDRQSIPPKTLRDYLDEFSDTSLS